MPQCKTINKTYKNVCIGDMDAVITLQTRNIKAPSDLDFDEEFVNGKKVWALHQVMGNKTIFDDTNTEVVVTDRFYINYDASVTNEMWAELDDDKYDIVSSPLDIDGRREFMALNCAIRGNKDKPVNFA